MLQRNMISYDLILSFSPLYFMITTNVIVTMAAISFALWLFYLIYGLKNDKNIISHICIIDISYDWENIFLNKIWLRSHTHTRARAPEYKHKNIRT